MTTQLTGNLKGTLKSLIERVEKLTDEKKAIGDDIKEVFSEARATGFDVKAMRTVIKMRQQDADERAEQEALIELYAHAIGLI